ncbi:AMP-binding protein [Dactylosporangium sp. NBC_01737]|uniref:AMP-binding protein n=1 Tax=Dactylosporangium sp. NBC_01737 TaxID=2975959 RepID=UPI002E10F3C1|nr:AMP-binding protein [Dactylosporangium sp. NBC_01737]
MDTLHRLTLGDLAREHRRSRPGVTAAVDGAERLSYVELDDRANRVASALAVAGVEAGDRVLWLGQTSARVLELLLGCAKLGAVLCPANARQSADELRFVLRDLDPRVVVWQPALGDAARESQDAAPDARWVEDGDDYRRWLDDAPPEDDERSVDPGLPVLALYTAAFDGRPSAALLSHTALLTHSVSIGWIRQIEPGFTYLNSGPLFHVGTMMFCLATLHLGGTNVFTPGFVPAEVCRLVEQERCTSAFLYGPMLDQLVEANTGEDGKPRHDLSSLHFSAGSDVWNAMITVDESPWGRALGGYGQSEVAGMLTFTGLGLGALGSHGRPSPFAQVRIVDAGGAELPAGEVGEMVARGPIMFSGYWNRPELNAAKRAGGWHHTGDLARRETDGTITFIGPKLRMIKSGGENVYPAEVERALATHPGIKEAAVIGVPDERWGQTVKAIVVATDPALTADDVVAHVRDQIASYKKPGHVVFAESLPRRGFTPDYDALDEAYGGGGYPIV